MKSNIKSCLMNKLLVLAALGLGSGCDQQMLPEPQRAPTSVKVENGSAITPGLAALVCSAQTEQTDYSLYKISSDGVRVGDVMPYYDTQTAKFYVYYLKDVWNDATHQRHPWYGFSSSNFYAYSQLSAGEILNCSTNGCNQDFAIGTGCVIKRNSTFYGFYTGHNQNYPSGCVTKKEGVMLATSTGLNKKFSKNASFATIYAPTGQGFDENDNFRDPYVFLDGTTYYMLLTARKNVNGTWKGVIAKYTSTNLMTWSYQGVMYDGGSDNFFMMETPEIFKMGSTYYLLFSDIDTKYVYYRKSSSVNGPWSKPIGADRFDGKGIYAAKTAANSADRYIFGWTNILTGHTDAGNWGWGGNLVVHKLYQKGNGDLAVTIPHTLQAYMNTTQVPIIKNSQWGNVTNTIPGTHSYNLVSSANLDVANVIFDPVVQARYKISATVSYSSAARDFGFMIGACDGYEDFYSLRFVPSQNRFSFDKVHRSSLTPTTVAANDVPILLSPNTNYFVEIVVENSMVVVYLNNEVALSCRIYKATGTNWGIFVDHANATFSNIEVKRP